jgi:hypothetical protein
MKRLLVLSLALAACRSPRGAQVLKSRNAAESTLSVQAKGMPFVLADTHAVEEGFWLPNNTLIVRSDTDIYCLDPKLPSARKRVALPRKLGNFAGAGDAFLTSDSEQVILWDARTLKTRKVLYQIPESDRGPSHDESNAINVRVSPDGRLAAIDFCNSKKGEQAGPGKKNCGWKLFDAKTGEEVFDALGIDKDNAGMLSFSDDSAYVVLEFVGTRTVIDLKTRKKVARQKSRRLSEGGAIQDYFELRGSLLLMSQGGEFIVQDLDSRKVLSRIALASAPTTERIGFGHDAAAKRVAIVEQTIPRVTVFTYGEKPTSRTYSVRGVKDFPMITGADFDGGTLVISDVRLDLEKGVFSKVEGAAPEVPRIIAESEHYRLQLSTASPGVCSVLGKASRRPKAIVKAACSGSPESGSVPRFSIDERFLAYVYEGTARILSVETGEDLGGLGGPVDVQSDALRAPTFVDGKLRLKAPHHQKNEGPQAPALFFSHEVSQAVFEPVLPHGASSFARTRTNVFLVVEDREEKKRFVTAYDLIGKELRREAIARFDHTMFASDGAAILRSDDGHTLCEASKPCRALRLPEDSFVHSFSYPWVFSESRKEGHPLSLTDVRTDEPKLLSVCTDHRQASVFGPSKDKREDLLFKCEGEIAGLDITVVTATGKVLHTVRTERSRKKGEVVADAPYPYHYELGVTNFGLHPGARTNLETGDRVALHIGADFAIAAFKDGAIERFGDAKKASTMIYCLEGEQLLPYEACSEKYDTKTRFQAP